MYPGISTQIFIREKLDSRHAALVRAAGFEAAEVYGFATHFDINNISRARAVKHFFSEEGIEITALHCPFSSRARNPREGRLLTISNENENQRTLAIEAVQKSAEAAAVLETRVIVIHFGLSTDTTDDKTESSIFCSMLRIEEILRDSGITAAYENICSRTSRISYMKSFIEKFEFKNAGICLDIGHANLIENPVQAILDCGTLLKNVHASDNSGSTDTHGLPGIGTIDWPEVKCALDKTGYNGSITLEPRPYGDLALFLRQAKEAFDTVVMGK